jgi:glutamate racemase
MSPDSPIGIFDSGIGGLTVADAIRKALPSESFIYFGDTEHMPYGEKSPEAIRDYSLEISSYLLSRGAKAIVIACNTASALAFDFVEKACAPVPVINVIQPVVDSVAADMHLRKIGVIGTRATIQSGVYADKIREAAPQLQVESIATPLFAQMIEEGFYNNSVSREVIRAYLKNEKFRDIDALILACTHYPLLQEELMDFFWHKVRIIDSPTVVATHLQHVLAAHGLENMSGTPATYEFLVSDYTETFERISRTFFREQLRLSELNLWERQHRDEH